MIVLRVVAYIQSGRDLMIMQKEAVVRSSIENNTISFHDDNQNRACRKMNRALDRNRLRSCVPIF